jgi:hypothetical protein
MKPMDCIYLQMDADTMDNLSIGEDMEKEK